VTLKDFATLLETVTDNVGHFKAKKKGFPRIIFGETDGIYVPSDGTNDRIGWEVEVMYFTTESFDSNVDALEAVFNDNRIPFEMVAVQHGAVEIDRETLCESVIGYLYECEVKQ